MKPFNFRQPLWEVITQNVYFPVFIGFVMGFLLSGIYEAFTGKDMFNVWHDRLFGIIYLCAGVYALFSSRKNAFTSFLLDTLGGLGLSGRVSI